MNYNEFLDLAKQKGLDNVQITATTVEAVEIEFIDEKLENYVNTNNTDYFIKAEKCKKTETIETDYLDEEIIDLLLMKINNTDSNYENEYLEKKEIKDQKEKVEIDADKEFEILKNIYKYKEKDKRISKITSAYEDSYIKTKIINSNGANLETSSHNYLFYIDVLVEDNDEGISYDKQVLKTNKEDIDFNKIINETIDEALIMIDKEDLQETATDTSKDLYGISVSYDEATGVYTWSWSSSGATIAETTVTTNMIKSLILKEHTTTPEKQAYGLSIENIAQVNLYSV